MKVITDENKIMELLSRRLENIFPSKEEAMKRFQEGKPLRIYLGIDPTGPDIHIGHTIPLLVLKQLADLGHKPILLIGDFTARIGDPTDKEATRTALTEEQVKNNMEHYLEQVYKILSKESFEVEYNSKWLAKMNFENLLNLTSKVTVQQMMKRDMFRKRANGEIMCNVKNKVFVAPEGIFDVIKSTVQELPQKGDKVELSINAVIRCPFCQKELNVENFTKNEHSFKTIPSPIYLHEFLYPLMQGYDSVAMDIDGEVGGNDQTFNMLVGRDLEKSILKKDKLVLATKLLVNAQSGKKMSKSEGGLIAINDKPEDIFQKIHNSVPNEVIATVFELCTEKDQKWINDNLKPKDITKVNHSGMLDQLAYELVRMYHGKKKAEKAKNDWRKEDEFPGTGKRLAEFVSEYKGISMSAAKDLIDQRAVEVNGQTVTDWNYEVKNGDKVQIGNKRPVSSVMSGK